VATADDELERFCQEQWPRLLRAMWLHCGDPDVAEDLSQEALVRVWERWSTVRGMDRPDLWVLRVAFNLATSRWRRGAVEARARRVLGAPSPEPDMSVALETRLAVLALPPRQRAAVLLRHGLGFPVRDAAVALDCAEGTVKALTHQGLQSLRDRLTEKEEAR
jgi:RNA polymerase sigma factor (sigma-70 family)